MPLALKSAVLAGAAALLASAAPTFANTWVPDPTHTEVVVSWGHIGFSTQSLEFLAFEGALEVDLENVEAASANFTVKTESVHTGVEVFDTELLGETWFNVEAFPDARFVSTSVQQTGDNTVRVTGDLTIKDNTNEIVWDVTVNKIGENPVGQFFDYYKGTWMGVTATTEVPRSEFGLGAFEGIGTEMVTITINTEMKQQ